MLFLQPPSVLEEVRHRSSPIYKRLRDIIANQQRSFFVFVNEHRQETYVEREPGESANDRNDRAIRVSCSWFKDHWSQSDKAGTGWDSLHIKAQQK